MGEIMSEERLCLSTLAFLDEESVTINKQYLIEFCKLVIYQAGIIGCTVPEVKSKIQELCGLEYSEDELLLVLENGEEFVGENAHYSLTSDANKEIQQREKSFPLRKYIDLFCDIKRADSEELDRNKLCDLITKFIYCKFRQSVEQISRLLQNDAEEGKFEFEEHYTDDEIDFINKFLTWDNDEKNKIIYSLVVRSYDFSVVNCPDDMELNLLDYNFYLDANIIMRMLGINNEYRKKAVSHFVNKCKEIGIVLHVTSFTKAEIKKSIKLQLESIDRELNRFSYIPTPDAIKFSKSDSFTIEMYGKYYEYRKKNKGASLERFSRYLYEQLERCISEFEYDDVISFEVQDGPVFNKYYEALCKIKDVKVVKTDVNNILLVMNKRDSGNENHFIISADGKLIEWCKSIFVGKTSVVEFPSVWLSIILKYSGRATGEDYASFCRFIKLPIRPTNTDIKRKIEISNLVIAKDIPNKMKDRMLEELDENYTSYKLLRYPQSIVEEAYNNVLSEHDEALKNEWMGAFEKEKEDIEKTNQKRVDSLVDQIRKEKEKSQKLESNNVVNLIKVEVNKKVEKRINFGRMINGRHNKIKTIIMIGIVAISFVVMFFYYQRKKEVLSLFNIVTAVIDAILFPLISPILKALGEIDDSYELRLRQKYEKKLKRKYKKILQDVEE